MLRLRKQLAEQGLDAGAAHHLLAPAHTTTTPPVGGDGVADPDPPRPDRPGTRTSGPAPPTSGSRPSCPTRCGRPTSPTTASPPTAPRRRDVEVLNFLDDHSRYLLGRRGHPRVTGAAGRGGVPRRGRLPRRPGQRPVRQRHGVHHPLRRRPRPRQDPQRVRDRARPPRHRAEELLARTTRRPAGRSNACTRPRNAGSPPNPTNPPPSPQLQALLERFADEYNTRRPHRSLHRKHPGRGLPRPTQSHPRPDHDSPADVRVRRDRVDTSGSRHPAPPRPAAPHRHRTSPRPNPRPAARPRPPHPRRQRHHRRTHPRTGPRPHPRLPTPTPSHHATRNPEPMRVRGYADVLRHHNVGAAGFEPATDGL